MSGLRARSLRGQGARPRGVPGSGLGAAAGEPLGPVPEAGGWSLAGEGRAVARSPLRQGHGQCRGGLVCVCTRLCCFLLNKASPLKNPV